MMKTIWIAAIDTRHWAFMAVGRTEDEAMLALEMGWEIHCLETGATIPWDELQEDVGVRRVRCGDCLRNGESMSEGM
jgi:hypothetical protein